MAYELAVNQQCQLKLQDELDKMFDDEVGLFSVVFAFLQKNCVIFIAFYSFLDMTKCFIIESLLSTQIKSRRLVG